MKSKLVFGTLVSLAIFVLPLAGNPTRLLHPAPWIGFVAALVTLVTQPAIGPRQMVADTQDRLSALGIFVGIIGSQSAAVCDFASRPGRTPALLSPYFVAGCLLVVGGLALRLWAIRTLGPFFTSTVSVLPRHELVESGPYRLIRHPSYTGTLVAGLGVSVILGSEVGIVLVVLLGGPAYIYRVRVEEKLLFAVLGVRYRSYAARTWAFMPFLL